MKASDLLVACLEAEGVECVFGIPGEETLDLNDSLERSRVRFVPVRHEQGGAYMADVYGRLTGRAGVCLGTLGPGALNLVTAVADAYLDRAPLVALTGQGDLERMHKESHQYVDLLRVMREIYEAKKPIACVCHGIEILTAADIIQGRTVTTVAKCALDAKQGGAEYVDRETVIDRNLVTARTWHDNTPFLKEFLRLLKEASL